MRNSPEAPQPARHSQGQQNSVLVIDDDPAILFAYCRLFEREGISVDCCECLHDAISHIRSNCYQAMVTDLRLTGTENLDGLEIIQTLSQEQPMAKVILVTGYGNDEIEKQARHMGASHYFEKPVRPSVILNALRDLEIIRQTGSESPSLPHYHQNHLN